MAVPQKKYICSYCARAFTRSEHKQRHERSHTNEKPFHCIYCTSAFVRRDLLQRHCRTVHHIHKVPRKMLQEKESATPVKILPKKEAATEKKVEIQTILEPALDVCQATAISRQRSAPDGFIASPTTILSTSSNVSQLLDSPISPKARALVKSTEMKTSSSVSDASLIASAKVLLQLAPHKAESTQLPRPTNIQLNSPVLTDTPIKSKSSPTILPKARYSEVSLRVDHFAQQSENPAELLQTKILYTAKYLERVCDVNSPNVSIGDMFLLGYSVVYSEPIMIESQYSNNKAHFMDEYFQGATFTDFDFAISYIISAIGAINTVDKLYTPAKDLINKAWTFLIECSSSQQTLVQYHLETIKVLFFLGKTYLRHFGNDLFMGYLEESTTVMLSKLALVSDLQQKELLRPFIANIWNVYLLVSKHKIQTGPPKFYSWAVDQNIDGYFSLSHYTLTFPKGKLPIEEPFFAEIVSCTLINEVNSLRRDNVLAIFNSHSDLHDAIALAVQSLVNYSLRSTKIDNFTLQMKKLGQDCPQQIGFYLKQNICRISEPSHWQILLLAIDEIDLDGKCHYFLQERRNSLFDAFGEGMLKFLSNDGSSTVKIETLSKMCTISNSLTFNSRLLQTKPYFTLFDERTINVTEFNGLRLLVIKWYLLIVKVFISLLASHSISKLGQKLTESLDLRALLHLTGIQVNKSITGSELIIQLYHKITDVFNSWLDMRTGEFLEFRINLARFFNILFSLASTNNNFLVERAYMNHGSVLLRGRKNSVIELKERRSLSMSLPIAASSSDSHTISSNYVLIQPKEKQSEIYLPPIEMPTSVLPPLVAFNGLPLPTQERTRSSFLGMPNLPHLALKSHPFVLPPLHQSINSCDKDGSISMI